MNFSQRRILKTMVFAFALCFAVTHEVAAQNETINLQRQNLVSAQITGENSAGGAMEARLQITRRGERSEHLISVEENSLLEVNDPVVGDLDGDREPEIVVNVLESGAYCCARSFIFRYQSAARRYAVTEHEWGNYRNLARLQDLDGDRVPEFVSANEGFSGAFCPYVCSGAAPIQIWRYRAGRLIDITQRFPRLIRRDAAHWWREFNDRRSDWHNSPVALAAFLADKHSLNEAQTGWRMVREVYQNDEGIPGYFQSRREYFARLRRVLREENYARRIATQSIQATN